MALKKLTAMLCVVAFFVVDFLSACGPSGAIPLQWQDERHCASDLECDNGYFCHSKFNGNTCQPCTDCSKWKRIVQRGRECPKSKSECGECEPGYEDDGDLHCMPTEQTKKLLNANNISDASKVPFLTWVYVAIGVLVIAGLCVVVYFGVGHYQRKKRRRSLSGEGDDIPLKGLHDLHDLTPSAPQDDSAVQPPAYASIVDKGGYPVMTNMAVVNESCQEAVPFSLGNSYSTAAAQYLEEVQVVPDVQEQPIEPMEAMEVEEIDIVADDNQELEEDYEDDEGPDGFGNLSEDSVLLEDHPSPMGQENPSGEDLQGVLAEPDEINDNDLPSNEDSYNNIGEVTNPSQRGDYMWMDDLRINVNLEFLLSVNFSFSSSNLNPPPRSLCSTSFINNSSSSLDNQNDSGISNSNSPPQSPGGPPSSPSSDDDGTVPSTDSSTNLVGAGLCLQPYYPEVDSSQAQTRVSELSQVVPENLIDDEGFDGVLEESMELDEQT